MGEFSIENCIIISKFLGFLQLRFLHDTHKIDTLIADEVTLDNFNEKLSKYSSDKRLTIRTAVIAGDAFQLPSKLNCSKEDAFLWIKEMQQKSTINYEFFVSPYFESKISGRIQLESRKTNIEFSIGDFKKFSHGIIDYSMQKDVMGTYKTLKETDMISNYDGSILYYIQRMQELANKLFEIYQYDLSAPEHITYAFDFSIGSFAEDDEEFFKIISMRTYNLSALQLNCKSFDELPKDDM